MWSSLALGALIVGLPVLAVARLMLWPRNRAVFFFTVALLAVGLGYLAVTGALSDIGAMVLGAELQPI
ncbi:MAG: hypothetical protein R3D33_00120 [Hyphomicrobiaceae bacterium]